MANHFVVIATSLICTVSFAFCNPWKIVETENGRIAGERRGNYYAFEGLRFASPPLADNRFQPPQPYTEYWKDVRNFTKIGPVCLQWNSDKVVGEEDCLFGNVYTPVKKPYKGYKFPVIVHIHGGTFQSGDASSEGHEYIMRHENFVFAAFNYRLGIMGFLSTESSVVPGNMGFKDQVMALKWVQRNIAAFDGDVASVTLTGFSAGAVSVHLHYMSPLSAGLFHRGISHSGVATVPWILAKNPLDRARQVADRIGCSNTDHQNMIDCMRTKPASSLVRTATSLTEIIGGIFPSPFVSFAAVVEAEYEEAFITLTPREYLKRHKIQKLPWLTSVTKDEGAFITGDLYSDEIIAEINRNWDRYTSLFIDINSTDPAIQSQVGSALKRRFFDDQPLSKKNFNQLTKLITQRLFHCGMEESVRLQRKIAPIYSYLYNYKIHFGFVEFLTRSNVNLGVSHGEDILLLYSTPIHAPPFAYSDGEKLMMEKLLEMYATFAEKGVPKFNNKCLTKSKKRVKYTLINGPEAARQCVAEPICDNIWKEIADQLNDVKLEDEKKY